MPPRATAVALARRLLPYAWRRRAGLAAVAATTLAQVLLAAAQPWPIKVLVDNVLHGDPLTGPAGAVFAALPGPESRNALLWWVAAASLLVFLLGWAMQLATSYAGVRFGQRLAYDVAGDLYAHLQRLSLRYHARNGIGSSIRRITTDSGCVATIVQSAALPAVTSAVGLITMLAIMVKLDVTLTLLALGVIPLMVLALRRYSAPMLDRSYEQQAAEGAMYDTVEQTLTALPVVKAFGGETAADRDFRRDTDHVLRTTIAMTWAQFRFKILTSGATALGTAAIFYIAGRQALAGSLTVGTMLVFLYYLASLYAPLVSLMYTSATVNEAAGSAQRVVEVLDAPAEVLDRPGALAPARVRGEVRFEHVSFAYEPDQPVLRDISFHARPGQTIAIVGATGAGKSTLVSLLPRFFDPDEGHITLDGHDLRDLRLSTVRDNVSLVLQESFLFPFTIAENIAYGRPDATPADIQAAATAANAHPFITALPDGYHTILGERGATLSGGERQRIAIARALLKDAPILILDEPTSALDAHTETLLLEALERLMHGRTTLIIAHRLSTIRNADDILVLHHGQLIEHGDHPTLIQRNGTYAHLHATQFPPPPAPRFRRRLRFLDRLRAV